MKKLFFIFGILTSLSASILAMNNKRVLPQDNDTIIVQLLGKSFIAGKKEAYDPKYYYQDGAVVAPIEQNVEMPLPVIRESPTLYKVFESCSAEQPNIVIGDTIQGVCTLSLTITLELMKKNKGERFNASLANLAGKLRKKRYLLMLLNSAAYLDCKQPIADIFAQALLQKIENLMVNKNKVTQALSFVNQFLAPSDHYDQIYRLLSENFSLKKEIETTVKSTKILNRDDIACATDIFLKTMKVNQTDFDCESTFITSVADKLVSYSRSGVTRVYDFYSLNDFTLLTLFLLQYLQHHKTTLNKLPATHSNFEAFLQLPQPFQKRYAHLI